MGFLIKECANLNELENIFIEHDLGEVYQSCIKRLIVNKVV